MLAFIWNKLYRRSHTCWLSNRVHGELRYFEPFLCTNKGQSWHNILKWKITLLHQEDINMSARGVARGGQGDPEIWPINSIPLYTNNKARPNVQGLSPRISAWCHNRFISSRLSSYAYSRLDWLIEVLSPTKWCNQRWADARDRQVDWQPGRAPMGCGLVASDTRILQTKAGATPIFIFSNLKYNFISFHSKYIFCF